MIGVALTKGGIMTKGTNIFLTVKFDRALSPTKRTPLMHRALSPMAPIMLLSFVLFVSCSSAAVAPKIIDPAQYPLPDFGFAGYEHSDQAIPDIAGPLFRVDDYGARANDALSDALAIQAAVNDCQLAGGGVVLFGSGRYILNDDAATATSPRVRISSSGVVLRGAGSGKLGTELYSPREMQPVDPQDMWSGRSPLLVQPEKPVKGSRSAKVKAPAAMNTMILQLETNHPFKVGDRIALYLRRKGDQAASFVAPFSWDSGWTVGVTIREYHAIQAVNGAAITLAEPIMIPVDQGSDWLIQEANFISNIGIEDIAFRGAWQESFKHHRSWRDDSAWRGIICSGVENSWIRRCSFQDMNWPILIEHSRQVTIEDVDMTGAQGHFGMQVINTYGILGNKVRDFAGHHHGPSVQAGACATVYHACTWASDSSFDSHANNPYATLFDSCSGGMTLLGVGGAIENYPHHLHGLVIWNQHVQSYSTIPVDFWTVGYDKYPRSFVQVMIFGMHGTMRIPEGKALFKNESPGTAVFPGSLWKVQRDARKAAGLRS